jgi:hypothetical protein
MKKSRITMKKNLGQLMMKEEYRKNQITQLQTRISNTKHLKKTIIPHQQKQKPPQTIQKMISLNHLQKNRLKVIKMLIQVVTY